jgi:hypothetical protein
MRFERKMRAGRLPVVLAAAAAGAATAILGAEQPAPQLSARPALFTDAQAATGEAV